MDEPPKPQPPDESILTTPLTYRWVWLIVPLFAAIACFIDWTIGELGQRSSRMGILFMTGLGIAISAGVHVFYRFVPADKRSDACTAFIFGALTVLSIIGEVALISSDGLRAQFSIEKVPPFFLSALFGSFAAAAIGNLLNRSWASRFETIASSLFVLLIAGVFLVPFHDERFRAHHGIMFSPAGEGARFVLPFLWLGIGLLFCIGAMRDKKESLFPIPFIIIAWPLLFVGVGGLVAIIVFAILLGLIYGISYVGYLLGHPRLITSIVVAVMIAAFILVVFLVGRKDETKPEQTKV